ncbi:hypothetical protein CVD28_00460 [Bacillus sp. M6-12]|uniref:hypothetical protein n=1 Tax=Bacillus sp. M6-12 TaxID=2054166 RepID=UPI000C791616|nr:hypothetical protein [Bacillus sp. M6-12]PLS18906.1 hypothetical protein CVD28_00460 [Bacillus sp. M6-12]
MNEITRILSEEIKIFLKEYQLQKPLYINSGHCKTFSERVKRKFPKAEIIHVDQFYQMPTMYAIDYTNFNNVGTWRYKKLAQLNNGNNTIPKVFDKLLMTPFHQWIYYEGKHYDAEEINGVENLFDLPYFQDYIKAEENPESTLIERTNKESLRRMIGI